MAVTVQDADEGDTATSIETLIDAAEQIETVVPDCEIKEAALAANGSCVSAANDSNARAPISMKQDACGACISGVTTTFANGCWCMLAR